MKNRCIALVCLLFFGSVLKAQDVFYNQFNVSLLNLNPAFAGSSGGLRTSALYRIQYPKIAGGSHFEHFSADMYLNKIHGGIGLVHDWSLSSRNTFSTSSLGLIYAQQIKLRDSVVTLIPAVQFSRVTQVIDWTGLSWGDQLDRRRGFTWFTHETSSASRQLINSFDWGFGLLIVMRRFTSGVAVQHPFRVLSTGAKVSTPVSTRYSIHASYKIDLRQGKWLIIPGFVCTLQGHSEIIAFGTQINRGDWTAALYYRNPKTWMPRIAYHHSWLGVSYSYNNANSTMINTGGSHECAFQLLLLKRMRKPGRCYMNPFLF